MSKAFVTTGTGASQTIEQIQNDSLMPIYSTEADIENDLNNLNVGQIVATPDGGQDTELISKLVQMINAIGTIYTTNQNAITVTTGTITFDETLPAGKYLVSFRGVDHASSGTKFCEFNENPITEYGNDGSAVVGGFGSGSTTWQTYSCSGLLVITEPTDTIYYHNAYNPLAGSLPTLILTRII